MLTQSDQGRLRQAERGLRAADPDWARLARAHGAFCVVSGLWPLLSLRTFEKVFGPKVDEWLVYTVGGLLVTVGWAQVTAADTPDGRRQACRLGIGSCVTFLAVDLVYVSAGRLRKTYLLDAVAEGGWLLAWIRERRREKPRLSAR